MKSQLPKTYEPSLYEDGIYKKWEKSGVFNPDKLNLDKKSPSYSIVMPPPNRTGTLHMGHAVMLALEDILTRYHRMKGHRTLWLPGTDHAAIATQTKVEKILKEEGKNRHEMGREKFLNRVRQFAQESHDTIVNQVKKMGCSCDWDREAYTLDEVRNKAVNTVFKLMYDDGLIYRGQRIVNWCPRCHSTLADDEVEYQEEKGKFYWIKYGPFVLATARPETKLGDTAVAVHPDDKRYKDMVGKKYMIPGVLGEFEITVIADRAVDPEFGSGAIKVTPAHSFIDNEMAAKNNIPMKQIINEDGRMMENCGKYAGMTTKEARKTIVKDMEKMGLIDHIEEDYKHNISVCYRCDTQIEPIPSEQWFIDVNKKIPKYGKSIKELSIEAVKKGVFGREKIKIVPKRFEKNYFHWMENLRDWCISRQIWFGHQVPVWYKGRSKKEEVRSKRIIELNFRDKKMYDAVKSGDKTVETRALNPEEPDRYFGDIKVGDKTRCNFIQKDKLIEYTDVIVKSSQTLKTIDDLLDKYDIKNIIPGGKREDLEKFYNSINGYTDKIKEHGLIAFKFEKDNAAIKDNIYLMLVRHGQTDWNKNGIMQGQKDVPLNNKGKNDALKLRKKIEKEKFDLIITSPLKRTSKTAELLNSYGVEIIEDDRLKERSYGKFEGKKTNELLKDHPEIETFEVNGLQYWIKVPTAETYDEVRNRVRDFLDDIKKKYTGKRVLVVSHGDTLDMFYAVLNNIPNEKAYGRYSLNMRLEKYEIGRDEAYVGVEPPKGKGWIQDEDTLDTWFSSGLWTFSTLADKPEQIKIKDGKLVIDSEDFRNFHPTSVLETGYDILFFWVARMIIMTTYAVGDIPFQDVYLHGLIRDEKGRKMSKSLGNVIDPLDMIKKYGTDATRLSLLIGMTPGNDSNLSEAKIAGYRNFVNKLWNVARYILSNVEVRMSNVELNLEKLTLADKWILYKLEDCIEEITIDLENYQFSSVGESLQSFTWNFCADWYLEITKFQKGSETEKVLIYILETLLKLWHPFIPFITEKIWEELDKKNLLMIEGWPEVLNINPTDRQRFNIVIDIVTDIRNARAFNGIDPGRKVKAIIYAGKQTELIESQAELIKSLRTGIGELEVKEKGKEIKKAIFIAVGEIEIYLIGAVDEEKERKRIEKEIAELNKLIANTEKKLADKDFVAKAPPIIVDKERSRLKGWLTELKRLQEKIKELKKARSLEI